MVGTDTFTPNLHLTKVGGDRKNWNDLWNGNMTSLDAVISAFFTVSNMTGIWENSRIYAVGDAAVDPDTAVVWTNAVAHTSAMLPTTFAEDRTANPTYWAIYSAPATNKGAWSGPGTSYSRNDFVLADGTKYAFCLVPNVSGASFSADLALGYWSVIIDLSIVGSLVLPVLSGASDANKFVVTNPTGVAYSIVTAAASRLLLGASTLGEALFTTANAAAARTSLGLGTAAVLNVGVGASNIVQLDSSAKLPGVDASQLLNVAKSVIITSTYSGAVTTGSGTTPYDDTIPQITEGTERMTCVVNRQNAASTLVIVVSTHWGVDVFDNVTFAIHQDVTANAIYAVSAVPVTVNQPNVMSFSHTMPAGATGATTLRLRIGCNGGSTVTMNGVASGRKLGGISESSIIVYEILP